MLPYLNSKLLMISVVIDITLSWMADSYLVIVWDQNLVVGIDFYMIIDNHCVFLHKKII